MRKVNSMLEAVLREAPAARVSSGWISVGYSQQMGPHDLRSLPRVSSCVRAHSRSTGMRSACHNQAASFTRQLSCNLTEHSQCAHDVVPAYPAMGPRSRHYQEQGRTWQSRR